MDLKGIHLSDFEYFVLDGMDTVAPRGDRLGENEAILRMLFDRHPKNIVETDPKVYMRRVNEGFEVKAPHRVGIAEEAVARVRAANLEVSTAEAILLFFEMVEIIAAGFEPYGGVYNTIALLQSTGKKVLMYSTALNLGMRAMIQSGITARFDRVYFSNTLGFPKFNAESPGQSDTGFNNLRRAEMVVAERHLSPARFVMFDDDNNNCYGAELAGWTAVQVRTREGHSSDWAPEHFRRSWIDTLSDISQFVCDLPPLKF